MIVGQIVGFILRIVFNYVFFVTGGILLQILTLGRHKVQWKFLGTEGIFDILGIGLDHKTQTLIGFLFWVGIIAAILKTYSLRAFISYYSIKLAASILRVLASAQVF